MQQVLDRPALGARIRGYVALTKPRIIELLLVTTVPTMVVAEKGMPPFLLMFWTVIGGTLAAGGANAINMYVDRDIDAIMKRTQGRPLVTGVLTGMAGSYLSTGHGAGFVRDMTAGKGYLALAALIFGKWRPGSTLFACLLFAFTDAVQVRLQGVELPGIGVIPVQFIQMLPYVLTVLLLAGFVGKAVAPKASGIPYVKER